MSDRMAWRQQPISLEQWKAKCEASSHRRPHEVIRYSEERDVISANVVIGEDHSIFIGAYFLTGKNGALTKIMPGTGWCYD